MSLALREKLNSSLPSADAKAIDDDSG